MKPIVEEKWEYTDEFKQELDRRYDRYISGGKMINAEEVNRRIKESATKIRNREKSPKP